MLLPASFQRVLDSDSVPCQEHRFHDLPPNIIKDRPSWMDMDTHRTLVRYTIVSIYVVHRFLRFM